MPGYTLIDRISVGKKAVAFTFDDGPDPLYTPQILDIEAVAILVPELLRDGYELVTVSELLDAASQA